VKVVVGVGALVQELCQEFQTFNLIDRVTKVRDSASQIEYENKLGINLVSGVGGQLCSLAVERFD
jgi:hypothetical protein